MCRIGSSISSLRAEPVAGRIGRRLLLAGGAAGLAGCGFRPIYAPGTGGTIGEAQEDLAAVAVAIIPNRSGQELRQALQSRLERQGLAVARRYDLAVALGIGGEAIGIEQDSSVTHIRLVGTASWVLTAQDTQRSLLTQGTAKQLDGFNIINEQFFAADQASDFATKRIAEALADQITLQLAMFFNRRAAKG
jgi:LPS-assembly lipoprotein